MERRGAWCSVQLWGYRARKLPRPSPHLCPQGGVQFSSFPTAQSVLPATHPMLGFGSIFFISSGQGCLRLSGLLIAISCSNLQSLQWEFPGPLPSCSAPRHHSPWVLPAFWEPACILLVGYMKCSVPYRSAQPLLLLHTGPAFPVTAPQLRQQRGWRGAARQIIQGSGESKNHLSLAVEGIFGPTVECGWCVMCWKFTTLQTKS